MARGRLARFQRLDGNSRVAASNVQVAGQTTPYTFTYGYDLADDLTSETYPPAMF